MFKEEIARGIKLLNRINPGWVNQIDLDKLNMTSSFDCIIGQVYGDYCKGITRLEKTYYCDRYEYGFTANDQYTLTKEWKDAIINIRSSSVKSKSNSILDTKPENHNKLYTKDSVKDLLSKVMELGMTTRENQLNCSELRFGREVLEEFIKINL